MRPLEISEIAERLGVSIGTVRSWAAKGELRCVNVSKNPKSRKPRVRVTQEDYEAFLEGRRVGAAREVAPRQRKGTLKFKRIV